jgi:hypothetical protein
VEKTGENDDMALAIGTRRFDTKQGLGLHLAEPQLVVKPMCTDGPKQCRGPRFDRCRLNKIKKRVPPEKPFVPILMVIDEEPDPDEEPEP